DERLREAVRSLRRPVRRAPRAAARACARAARAARGAAVLRGQVLHSCDSQRVFTRSQPPADGCVVASQMLGNLTKGVTVGSVSFGYRVLVRAKQLFEGRS